MLPSILDRGREWTFRSVVSNTHTTVGIGQESVYRDPNVCSWLDVLHGRKHWQLYAPESLPEVGYSAWETQVEARETGRASEGWG